MKLQLTHGYPYPFPLNASLAEQDRLSEAAASTGMIIEGVRGVELLHTITVEFHTQAAYLEAKEQTGWPAWDDERLILEALHSHADGYNLAPAIVAKGLAYCGFFLLEDEK